MNLRSSFAFLALCVILFNLIGVKTAKCSEPSDFKEEIKNATQVHWESVKFDSINGLTLLSRSYPEISARDELQDDTEAETTARSFISALAEIPGIPQESDLNLLSVTKHSYTQTMGYEDRDCSYIVAFKQTYNGITVYGTEMLVSMTKTGDVYMLKNSSQPVSSDQQIIPNISPTQAYSLLLAKYDTDTLNVFDGPELNIYKSSHLAWRFQIAEPIHKMIFMDALTGDIIDEFNNLVNQIPEDQCWVHGNFQGNRNGRTDVDNFVNLAAARAIIYEDDASPSTDDIYWQGESENNGNYNESAPVYVSIWEGTTPGVDPAELFVEAGLDNDKIEVSSGAWPSYNTVAVTTGAFTPASQQEYVHNLTFNSDMEREGSCSFIEMHRGWNYRGKVDKVYVHVHNARGPSTNGEDIYFPADRATLPGDTQLHEFGHTIMYEKYGHFPSTHTTGHPGQCPNNCLNCDNHGGDGNECSADAVMEGWANYFPVAVYNEFPAADNPADQSYDWSNSTSSHDLESNTFNDDGRKDEWAIAALLWDIRDDISETDDDNLHLGPDACWHIMMDLHPYTTKEMYEMMYVEYQNDRANIWQVFENHGIEDNDAPTDIPSNLTAQIVSQKAILNWDPADDPNWNAVDNQLISSGSKSIVQISTDPGFTDISEHETSILPLEIILPVGEYYWRVKGSDYAGNDGADWSAVATFTIEKDPIFAALAWLRTQQTSGGYWYGSQYSDRIAATGLAVQAFLAAGYSPDDDETVQKGINYILSQQKSNGGIYYNSGRSGYKTAMALTALKSAAKYNPSNIDAINAAISSAESYYISNQNPTVGGWRYEPHIYKWDYDLSVSQWPILALKGVDNSTLWSRVRTLLHNYCRTSSGGYRYRSNYGVTGTMTCAGIWGEIIAGGPQSYVDAAFNWLESQYGTALGIVNAYDHAQRYYYLYSLAKACALAGKTRLAGENWYEILSGRLEDTQAADHWHNSNVSWENDVLSTAWALLSLQVGTVPPDSRFVIRLTSSSPGPVAKITGADGTDVDHLTLHVYDAEGNFAGMDESENWVCEIPGSRWNMTGEIMELEISLTAAGAFSVEIHNESGMEKNYLLEMEAYQGNNPDPVDEEEFSGSLGTGQIVGTNAAVNSIGGLSIYSSAPELFPQMVLSPEDFDFTPIVNDEIYEFSFTVSEIGEAAALTNIDIFASDMIDEFGNIIPASAFEFTPSHIDEIAPGGSYLVEGRLTVPSESQLDLSDGGTFTGALTVESTRQSRSISLHGEARLLQVSLDIKPGSCPNPLNIKNAEALLEEIEDNSSSNDAKIVPDSDVPLLRSVVPVAILGTEEFDVKDIDIGTVMLEGVLPKRWNYEDVATPMVDEDDECKCTTEGPDGYDDLTMKFDKDHLVAAIGEVENRDTVVLMITGSLADGTRFEGTDCVIILGAKENDAPEGFSLDGNNPNPFNPFTIIRFGLPYSCDVSLKVYNILGQEVTTLVDGQMEAGFHSVTWDGSRVASGIYFYRLIADRFVASRKMLLIK